MPLTANLDVFIPDLRREAGDPNGKRWPTAELVYYTNFGSRDYAARTRILYRTETVNTVAGTETYVLSDLYGARLAQLKLGTNWYQDLRVVDEPYPEKMLPAGQSQSTHAWTDRRYVSGVSPVGLLRLGLAPIPGAVYEIFLEGWGLPLWLPDDTGVSDLAPEFLYDVRHYVLSRMMMHYRQWGEAMEHRKDYEKAVQRASAYAESVWGVHS